MTLTALEATIGLSEATGISYTLIGALDGGETGATAVRDPDGRTLVLKWDADPGSQARRIEAVALAGRLRMTAGWPVPGQRWIEDAGLLYVTQDFLPGTPVVTLTHALIDELVVLHARRLGLATSDDLDHWAEDLVETLVLGGNGYCRHESLQRHSDRTRRVVERIESIGRVLTSADLSGPDIVHWDFHPGNFLEVNGRLSAVIDLDFAKVGDARFDLVALALSSLATDVEPGVRTRLFEVAFEGLDEPRRSAYVAHILLRNIDWPLRKGRTREAEVWVGHADRLLDGAEP